MHFLTIFVTAASLLPLASAKCYKEGPLNTNKQLALDNLDHICKTMQGNFRTDLERTSCVTNAAQGNEWFFSVKCIAKTDKLLTYEQCLFGLRREIDGCNTGGDRKDGDWEYRSDSNVGVCMDTYYINNHPARKRRSYPVSGELVSAESEGKREVKVTYGNPVPPQPWEKRDVKVVFGNPVPPQPWETRARPVAV